MRWPETNSARSHQCEPMSANAREALPAARPRASCRRPGAGANPADRCRAEGEGAGLPAADTLARLAHRRVVPIDEGHSSVQARVGCYVDEPLRPAASRARGFSQITCLPAARAASASGTCRWFGVQMWTTSIRVAHHLLGRVEGSVRRRARRPGQADQGRAIAASLRSRELQRPCVDLPMNPVPAIAAWRRIEGVNLNES